MAVKKGNRNAVKRAVQMSGETEETKDEFVPISLKSYNAEKNRATCFFTKATANDIVDAIKTLLEDTETQFQISNNQNKITFNKAREAETQESTEENLVFKEQADI